MTSKDLVMSCYIKTNILGHATHNYYVECLIKYELTRMNMPKMSLSHYLFLAHDEVWIRTALMKLIILFCISLVVG